MRTALIIPALDEEEAIGLVLARVPRDAVAEILVVDNGSTDGTAAAAARAGARVVAQPRRGYGAACWAGLCALGPEVETAVFIDADGSQRPEEIPLVLAPLAAGRADLVLGARRLEANHPLHAVLGTRLVAAALTRRCGRRITDVGPFRAIRVDLLRRLGMEDRAYRWPIEMIVKAAAAGARIEEVPVAHDARLGGRSKVSGTVLGSARAGWAFLDAAARAAFG